MNDKPPTPPTVEYRCPGGRQPISRAVHLGRLAAFYPACRECPHREDTGSLSPRQVEQLAETVQRRRPRPLFHDEGAGGVFLDDLAPADARLIAAAFGVIVRGEAAEEKGEERREKREEGEDNEKPSTHHSSFNIQHFPNPQSLIPNPSIVLAGDGRPIAAELVAAVAEGLRWSGRDVVDIGPATAACMAFAVHHLRAAGGVLVGNPGLAPHEVGLQFWTAGPRPLSAGGGLESVAQPAETDPGRPTRRCGRMRRFQADEPYLAALSDHYHALRPLRVVVDSASKPLLHYLQQLCAAVACEIIPLRAARRDLPDQIRAAAAHFAVQIDGDGETCRVFDEQGREAPPARLLLLLARHIRDEAALSEDVRESSPVSVVLEIGASHAVAERLERLGLRPITSGPRRAEVSAAMQEHGAMLGFGPGARYWHSQAGVPLPDALMTVTRLLKLLSRGDEPFSGVLDRDVPAV
ncbi:MAG: hypothetical protein KKE86_02945 [Planctomycetes bacterium]|nr:hypothetical protein [Planctomycetota bacterium]